MRLSITPPLPPTATLVKNRHTKNMEQKKVYWYVMLYATEKASGKLSR